MNLLRLHPLIQSYVKTLLPGTPTKMVTERGLRSISCRPTGVQLALAKQLVRGFGAFVDGRHVA
jgi:hypothetical protein